MLGYFVPFALDVYYTETSVTNQAFPDIESEPGETFHPGAGFEALASRGDGSCSTAGGSPQINLSRKQNWKSARVGGPECQ